MDKVEILEQQLAAKERELAEINEKHQELAAFIKTLNSRLDGLSRLVENRHAVLDEANRAIAVAVERNHLLAGAMRDALTALPDGDVETATKLLAEALQRDPGAISEGQAFIEETKKMRDAALEAISVLNQSLVPVGS